MTGMIGGGAAPRYTNVWRLRSLPPTRSSARTMEWLPSTVLMWLPRMTLREQDMSRTTTATALARPAQGVLTADNRSLRNDGFILAAFTLAVMLIASVLVHAHLNGRLSLDDFDRQAPAMSLSRLTR